MMAEMFGFSQFKPIAREERAAGALGYWCIPISGGENSAKQGRRYRDGTG
jgi:hypothetical protein